jgi:hypothetical protein
VIALNRILTTQNNREGKLRWKPPDDGIEQLTTDGLKIFLNELNLAGIKIFIAISYCGGEKLRNLLNFDDTAKCLKRDGPTGLIF